MNNCTVRGGGITQRTGWQPLGTLHNGSAIFQGGYMYEPRDGSDPYLIVSIGGRIYRYVIDTGAVADLSAIFGLTNPADLDQSFFVQGEEFLVIQAGDGVTLPLIWDGNILRRSVGIISANNVPGAYPISVLPYNEIPAATCMDYYMGRIWYAQGRTYGATDIVGSSASGTVAYNFRDSVIKVTENPLCFGGDNFTVPSNSGNIRCIKHSANINSELGDGLLYIGTRKAVYSLQVPVTRADWIAADTNNQPLQKIAQLNNGWVNDRTVVPVNGDLFGQSLEPSIRSIRTAVRNQTEWGNVPISNNVSRALQFNDRALMRLCSGIEFDNRLWETCLPRSTPQGVVSDAVTMLDFDIISTLEEQEPPAWEGIYEGQQILQLFTGDFGGLDRAFSVMLSKTDSSLDVWELTNSSRTENGDNRVIWSFETPAFNACRDALFDRFLFDLFRRALGLGGFFRERLIAQPARTFAVPASLEMFRVERLHFRDAHVRASALAEVGNKIFKGHQLRRGGGRRRFFQSGRLPEFLAYNRNFRARRFNAHHFPLVAFNFFRSRFTPANAFRKDAMRGRETQSGFYDRHARRRKGTRHSGWCVTLCCFRAAAHDGFSFRRCREIVT